jgi:hypothetical protein
MVAFLVKLLDYRFQICHAEDCNAESNASRLLAGNMVLRLIVRGRDPQPRTDCLHTIMHGTPKVLRKCNQLRIVMTGDDLLT